MARQINKPAPPVQEVTQDVFNREEFFQVFTSLDEYGEEVQRVVYPFAGRIAEFRFLYPEGRILTELVESRCSATNATVKCSVYRNMEDEAPIVNAIATRELGAATDDYEKRFYECAETAAVVRALRLLGIGVDIMEEDLQVMEQVLTERKLGKPSKGKPEAPAPAPAEKPKEDTPAEEPKKAGNKPKVKEPDKVPETDEEAMDAVISTTTSKSLKGKTFAEALAMAKDMDAFAKFLEDLKGKGTPAEKRGCEAALKAISG